MVTTQSPATARRTRSASDGAFLLLRSAFTVAPIVFGLDKFTNLLTDWTQYLHIIDEKLARAIDLVEAALAAGEI